MAKIAFVFPGQGSQYVGMGKDMVEKYPLAQEIFKKANERLGYDLQELCFNGPEEKLKLTIHTQPALLTTSIACLQILLEKGVKADFAMGHSLGEYSALVAARALSFSDAVWLVAQRGKFMQEAVPPGEGTMAAILGLDQERVEALCKKCQDLGVIEPANYNCPGQIVIAGTRKAVEKAVSLAKDFGARRAIPLAVSGPFHSSLLKPASIKLAEAINQVAIKDPQIPVVANITAAKIASKEKIKQALIEQVNNSVKWEQSVRYLISKGVSIFIEIGAGKVLTGLIRKIDKNAKTFHVEDTSSLEKTLAGLKECR